MKLWRWTKTIEVRAHTHGDALIAVRDDLLAGALKSCDSPEFLDEVAWELAMAGDELKQLEPVSEGGE